MTVRKVGRLAAMYCRRFLATLRTVAIGASAVILFAGLGANLGAPAVALAGSCPNTSTYWYSKAVSGTGSTVLGTGAYTTTWSSWSVDHAQFGGTGAFSDEGQWVTGTYLSSSLEAGFYSGYGNNIAWTDSILPYSTYSNGSGEVDINSALPASTYIWVAVASYDTNVPGSVSYMSVGGNYSQIAGGSYMVSPPRQNFAQGEIGHSTSATSWMGGGSGESFSQYWLDTSGSWNSWGSHSDCNNSPYWVSAGGANQWSNGGY